jgi:hypothetical protein
VNGSGAVSLRWQPSVDCNNVAVAGYRLYRSTSSAGEFTPLNGQLIAGTEYVDTPGGSQGAGLSLAASDYYYAVTAVDDDGLESAQSAAVSPPALASTLANETSAGGSGAGGGGCFISTSQEAFNQDIMNGLAFLGVVVILWRLIMRIKARGRGAGRQSSEHGGANSGFDETTDLGFRVMTEKGNLVVTGTDDRAGKEKQASNRPRNRQPWFKVDHME